MGCFTKAAALLSLSLATAFVIPDSPSSSIPSSSIPSSIPQLEYHPSDNLLRFNLDIPDLRDGRPIFVVQVETAENQCGESEIIVNGERLVSSQWDGVKAGGTGRLKLDDSSVLVDASWQILCLSPSGPVDDISLPDKELVQVLTLRIEESKHVTTPGFTVSFHKAGIVQFDAHPTNLDSIVSHTAFWRTPSEGLSVSSSASKAQHVEKGFMHSANSQQQSLHLPFEMIGHLIKWEVKVVKNAASGAVKSCRHHFAWAHEGLHNFAEKLHDRFCQREPYAADHSLSAFLAKSSPVSPISLDELLGKTSQSHLASTTVTKHSETTNTSPSPAASQTRSLSQPEIPSSTQPARLLELDSDARLYFLKTIGIFVITASLLTWLIKRVRDPRRRADRAARREERRNRRLYRRAAQIQRWRNWIYAFRHKICPVAQTVDDLDEKRARVFEQESILDVAMNDDIRALRCAHVVVSGITAAEEGRNNYIYEAEASERRRSVVTLPGYESEGTQPPGYDENRISVVDGFRYALAESVDTPDSSVISTSPRISRDGRDSDFGKEPEWTL